MQRASNCSISRILSRVIIYLVPLLPRESSGTSRLAPGHGLAPYRVCHPSLSPTRNCHCTKLYSSADIVKRYIDKLFTFHPEGLVSSLWHFPFPHLAMLAVGVTHCIHCNTVYCNSVRTFLFPPETDSDYLNNLMHAIFKELFYHITFGKVYTISIYLSIKYTNCQYSPFVPKCHRLHWLKKGIYFGCLLHH